ncbi:protein CURVATURE THYLAKOID 1D, chloroplastic-like [Iris pallida]|uniref:Protein CURVATURE THYLAKOID 1D, chloroplastic-like n=1 Tax=Iris pallida TaxID=29817 RepID=A0AAX6FAN6_IRIPA|nr:protein CURVATURE THYLAKOID 1D, chloroplastic-like [Iris pallida]
MLLGSAFVAPHFVGGWGVPNANGAFCSLLLSINFFHFKKKKKKNSCSRKYTFINSAPHHKPNQNPSSPSPMDLRFVPRSLTILLPIARAHLRPTSLPKSFTSHFRSGFRATASSPDASTFVPDLEKRPNESAKDGIGEAPFEFVSGEESPEKSEAEEFVDKVNVKLDTDDNYSIFIYGTGALVALWLSSAVVGALDSIPLIPNVFELVGLAYTIWFSYRYLIFKKNREELFAKIDEIKGTIIGLDN